MKLDAARLILGKPAFHILVALLLGAAFVWPFLANTQPHRTWFFLHGVWIGSVLILYWIARGQEPAEGVESDVVDGAEDH